MDFKKKLGSTYTNLIPSINKLKTQRENIIASFGTNQLKAQIENNNKMLESFTANWTSSISLLSHNFIVGFSSIPFK